MDLDILSPENLERGAPFFQPPEWQQNISPPVSGQIEVPDSRLDYTTQSSASIGMNTAALQPSLALTSTALNQYPDMRREIWPFENNNIRRWDSRNPPPGGFAGESKAAMDSSHHTYAGVHDQNVLEWGLELLFNGQFNSFSLQFVSISCAV